MQSGFIVLTYLVIVGSSNAVNLTDGLDGLAIMPTVMVGVRWRFLPMWRGICIFQNIWVFRMWQALVN